MFDKSLIDTLRANVPKADFSSVRWQRRTDEVVTVRQDILQPLVDSSDEGLMVMVHDKGGIGYGATSDVSGRGLRAATEKALDWAKATAGRTVTDFSKIAMPASQGEYKSPVKVRWDSMPLKEKIARLQAISKALKISSKVVDWNATLWSFTTDNVYLTSQGGLVYQEISGIIPMISVTANEGSETQTRSFGGHGHCRLGGLEILDEIGFWGAGKETAEEAVALLAYPNCPSGKMDVLLAADQMILQVHESIGHPLELDRILGDERNYAGTTFVTLDMLGKYQYGSPLLNIVYDPSEPSEMASYAFDDEGRPATREFIIKEGILQRALGATISQARAGVPGVANARASGWNRPPVDRMANLNLVPGSSSFDEMVKSIEKGVYMQTNSSWSIDDSRNKFQFGCEVGQLIENGRLTTKVKKPNYRGISASFWRNLKMVGDSATTQIMGSPYCGKAEPNQLVSVGHVSPACVFADVDVFGGE